MKEHAPGDPTGDEPRRADTRRDVDPRIDAVRLVAAGRLIGRNGVRDLNRRLPSVHAHLEQRLLPFTGRDVYALLDQGAVGGVRREHVRAGIYGRRNSEQAGVELLAVQGDRRRREEQEREASR